MPHDDLLGKIIKTQYISVEDTADRTKKMDTEILITKSRR